jgi:predicted metal-dependent HD superfamily phosphohydrolase
MTSIKQLTEAERIAETLGVIVGAASCCEQVTEERLDSVVPKLRQLVLATANDGADAEAADERFSVALDAGRTAAESGKIDPEDAEAALSEMEVQLST